MTSETKSEMVLHLDFSFPDNTASVLTRRNGFRRQEQSVYYLPIFIVDSGSPSLSSTNTLTIRVCDCDADGVAQTCNAEAYVLPAGLSTGALVAILACVLTLLGECRGLAARRSPQPGGSRLPSYQYLCEDIRKYSIPCYFGSPSSPGKLRTFRWYI